MTATDTGSATDPDPAGFRVEKDALGEVRVPADHYWGAQTQRSIENFPIGVGRFRWGRPVIRALGVAQEMRGAGQSRAGPAAGRQGRARSRARRSEVIDGQLDDEFPLVVFQTGSGTQTNMNANEVIANRAIQLAGGVVGSKQPIHPNDDVNRGQSSNDAFPAVMHIATVEAIEERAAARRVDALRDTLDGEGRGVRRRRDDRPHAPAGRDAGDARPGDPRLGGAARRRRSAGSASRCPALTRWRSAAPRSAPG